MAVGLAGAVVKHEEFKKKLAEARKRFPRLPTVRALPVRPMLQSRPPIGSTWLEPHARLR
jgi:hypothetical protein